VFKKTLLVYLSVLLCVCVTACNTVDGNTNQSERSDNSVSQTDRTDSLASDTQPAHQVPTCYVMSLESGFLASVGMTIDIPGFGLKNLVVRRWLRNYTDAFHGGRQVEAYILADYRWSNSPSHDSYLVVRLPTVLLLFDFEQRCSDETLYYSDVDGDGIEEIIVSLGIGVLRDGFLENRSCILRMQDSGLQTVFDSSPHEQFDTGYSSSFNDGYSFDIENRFTGYMSSFDVSSFRRFSTCYFDTEGKVLTEPNIHYGSFFIFSPADIDGDDVAEIACCQLVLVDEHTGEFGGVESILKYNVQTCTFEVVHSSFELANYPVYPEAT